jgi:hypothetical protein
MVDCIFCRSKKIFKGEGLDDAEATALALKYTAKQPKENDDESK